MKPGSSLILALVAVAALILPRHGQAQAGCQLARIAEWPLKAGQEGFRFDGEINGKPAVFEIATDNATTFIWRSSLERLGLDVRKEGRFMAGGRRSGIVDLGELRIGPTVRKGFQAAVIGGPGPEGKVTVLLGNDYFETVDLELDLPGRAVRLFRPRDCESASIAYWAKDGAGSVPLDSIPALTFEVQVNGQPVKASLNTLLRISLLVESRAEKLGIDRRSPRAATTGCETFFSRSGTDLWIAPIETFAIGDELIRHPRLQITALGKAPASAPSTGSRIDQDGNRWPEVLLGRDFLATHRILISRAQSKLYFTHAGGLVFPSIPSRGCDGSFRATSRSSIASLDEAIARDPKDASALFSRAVALTGTKAYERALTDLEAALRLEPRNASGFAWRAWVHYVKGDFERAIADIGEAIRIDPRDASALAWRADAHMQRGDYDKAIADYDAAIAQGAQVVAVYANRGAAWRKKKDMTRAIADFARALEIAPRDVDTLLARGWTWTLMGKYESAIADCDAALAVEPRHKAALRSRGLANFYRGEFARAAHDFAELMPVDPNGQNAVWRYIARARDGKDGQAELRAFADGLALTDWPEPIIRFHLGQSDRDRLLASADNGDATRRKEQACEASFHLGQHHLIIGDPAAARPFLELAVEACPPSFVERQGAIAELARIR